MSSGVLFGDFAADGEELDHEAVRWGDAFGAAIPIPSAENGGLLQAALFWAAHVGAVFPLRRADAEDEDPSEAKKVHRTLGEGDEFERPTRDLVLIDEWWRQDPMANIGFGAKANGVLIIDVDARKPGVLDRWKKLRDEHGIDIRNVPRSVSPRGDGGYHLWYRLPPGADYPHSPIVLGVDRPWQVPVPPSLRLVDIDPGSKDPNQRRGFRPYVWRAGDPRVLPLAPLVLLGESIDPLTHSTPSGGDFGQGNGGIERVALDAGELKEHGVPMGSQSYTFKRLACSLITRRMPDELIINELMEIVRKSPCDPSHPWTQTDLAYIVRKSREFLRKAREKEMSDKAMQARQQIAEAWASEAGAR